MFFKGVYSMPERLRIPAQSAPTTSFQSALGTSSGLIPVREEILVPDDRASLGPAQIVEKKLKDLGQGSVSQMRLMSLISTRR
jgi:hypothetical protein